MAAEEGPRQLDAHEYLDKHRVIDLFNNLTSQLIYSRPDDPKKFLISTLEKLHKCRSTKLDIPSLFDDSNIHSVFGMLDPTNRGYITLQQYNEALTTLGVKKYDDQPAGADIDRIAFDVFVNEAKNGLTEASSTFST
ncbi:EF-hand calcium-binding domain-containing protein 10-like [Haliotis cracherodii]|uniref:EF-hand calcium-binding domain-containing protein 10-like n=1 Tax=Haliotis cracherodii TaxID=6455 RepID=UPI0039E89745